MDKIELRYLEWSLVGQEQAETMVRKAVKGLKKRAMREGLAIVERRSSVVMRSIWEMVALC